MEQRRRPPTDRINYRVNQKSGHIHTVRMMKTERNCKPYMGVRSKNEQSMNRMPKNAQKSAKVSYMADYKNKPLNKTKKAKRRFSLKAFSLKKVSFKPYKPLMLVGLLVVLSFAAVYQNAELQSWGLAVSEANAKLTALQNQNEALKQEKAELTNLDRIERIAKNDLKMVAPTSTILFESKQAQNDVKN